MVEDLHYWSPSQAHSTEVDFLLRRGKELCAIEVKSTARWGKEELKGLNAIGFPRKS